MRYITAPHRFLACGWLAAEPLTLPERISLGVCRANDSKRGATELLYEVPVGEQVFKFFAGKWPRD